MSDNNKKQNENDNNFKNDKDYELSKFKKKS